MELFAQATKNKLRFSTDKGILNTEDLWNMDLVSLNDIAVQLNKQLQDREISFIDNKNTDFSLQLKFDVVRLIIETKIQERDERKLAQEKLVKKQQLIALLNQKETEQLQQLSVEDIKKQLAELQ